MPQQIHLPGAPKLEERTARIDARTSPISQTELETFLTNKTSYLGSDGKYWFSTYLKNTLGFTDDTLHLALRNPDLSFANLNHSNVRYDRQQFVGDMGNSEATEWRGTVFDSCTFGDTLEDGKLISRATIFDQADMTGALFRNCYLGGEVSFLNVLMKNSGHSPTEPLTLSFVGSYVCAIVEAYGHVYSGDTLGDCPFVQISGETPATTTEVIQSMVSSYAVNGTAFAPAFPVMGARAFGDTTVSKSFLEYAAQNPQSFLGKYNFPGLSGTAPLMSNVFKAAGIPQEQWPYALLNSDLDGFSTSLKGFVFDDVVLPPAFLMGLNAPNAIFHKVGVDTFDGVDFQKGKVVSRGNMFESTWVNCGLDGVSFNGTDTTPPKGMKWQSVSAVRAEVVVEDQTFTGTNLSEVVQYGNYTVVSAGQVAAREQGAVASGGHLVLTPVIAMNPYAGSGVNVTGTRSAFAGVQVSGAAAGQEVEAQRSGRVKARLVGHGRLLGDGQGSVSRIGEGAYRTEGASAGQQQAASHAGAAAAPTVDALLALGQYLTGPVAKYMEGRRGPHHKAAFELRGKIGRLNDAAAEYEKEYWPGLAKNQQRSNKSGFRKVATDLNNLNAMYNGLDPKSDHYAADLKALTRIAGIRTEQFERVRAEDFERPLNGAGAERAREYRQRLQSPNVATGSSHWQHLVGGTLPAASGPYVDKVAGEQAPRVAAR